MLEQLKYKNHMNEVFEFGRDGIFVNTNDLHDYKWQVAVKNNRITAFNCAVTERTLPVVIVCRTEEEGIAARNRLHEVVEKDVLAMKHGQIMIGDYYFRCFVTHSKKARFLSSKRLMEATLTLTTDYPLWVRESTFVFRKSGVNPTGRDLDFNFDFPYDYALGSEFANMDNTAFVSSHFKMIIYGACIDPTVFISGHAYSVSCTLGETEYLTIDSLAKKIFITHNNGETTNVFHCRDRTSYIFEKIPVGRNGITWNGSFGVDITLYEERSEPKWT